MKKIKQNIFKKVIPIFLVFIAIFTFILPNYVYADAWETLGGVLISPIKLLVCGIGDAIMEGLQNEFVSYKTSIKQNENYYFMYTPGKIFSGKIRGLDVNFIDPLPRENKKHYTIAQPTITSLPEFYYIPDIVEHVKNNYGLNFEGYEDENLGIDFKIDIGTGYDSCESNNCIRFIWEFNNKKYELHYGNCGNASGDYLSQDGVYVGLYVWEDGVFTKEDKNYKRNWNSVKDDLVDNYGFPNNVEVKPISEKKFSLEGEAGEIEAYATGTGSYCVDVDYRSSKDKQMYTLELINHCEFYNTSYSSIYNPTSITNYDFGQLVQTSVTTAFMPVYRLRTMDEIVGEEINGVFNESVANKLAPTISKWYKILRIIALVGLLSILVYISIRMIISSSSKDSAKYKKMFVDWLTAMCLIFILHYLMVFIMQTIQIINGFLSDSFINGDVDTLFSNIRYEADKAYSVMQMFASTVMYVALVVLTCVFTVQYLKRVIYMAFLTMIAPLICLTYPLDKIKDGQAQALSMWLREYIFNALLQPMHLIIYSLLIRYC